MKKTLKLVATIFMAIILVTTCSQFAYATDDKDKTDAGSLSGLIDNIDPNTTTADASGLTDLAGNVIGLIQIASAVLAVILVAVFGFKFIMGSANEKADYQKSFIPLIVGVVVVFSATSIAKLLFSILG